MLDGHYLMYEKLTSQIHNNIIFSISTLLRRIEQFSNYSERKEGHNILKSLKTLK